MSNRSSGNCHNDETALAQRLLPQPCTPSNKIPFGAGRPNARASSVNATARFCSQSFSALYDAFYARQELTTAHILQALAQTVPLAKTLDVHIDRLRNWAEGRARNASVTRVA